MLGTISGSTVTATKVAIATPPSATTSSQQFASVGTVQTSPSSGSFVIETWNHTQLTVATTTTTTYTERGTTSAALASVQVGENVAVFGTLSGSTLTATQIAIAGNGVDGVPGYLTPRGPGHGGGFPGRHRRGGQRGY